MDKIEALARVIFKAAIDFRYEQFPDWKVDENLSWQNIGDIDRDAYRAMAKAAQLAAPAAQIPPYPHICKHGCERDTLKDRIAELEQTNAQLRKNYMALSALIPNPIIEKK